MALEERHIFHPLQKCMKNSNFQDQLHQNYPKQYQQYCYKISNLLHSPLQDKFGYKQIIPTNSPNFN